MTPLFVKRRASLPWDQSEVSKRPRVNGEHPDSRTSYSSSAQVINSSSATLHPHQQLAPIRPHVPHDKQTQNGSASTPTISTTAACNSTNMGPYASLKGYVLHIQENRCYKPVYARAKRCMTCITKIAGRVCLFRDLRVFVLPDTPNASIKETTPTFFATFSKGATFEWLYSHNSNRDITNEEKDRLIETASQALLPSLQNAMRLAALPHAVCRPSSRIARRTCQHCSDFFSISYWFCTDCGREFCAECQEKIKHLLPAQDGGKPATSPQAALELARELPDKLRTASNLGFDRLSPSISVVAGKIQDKSLHQLLSCSLGRLHGAESLIPVTTLPRAALSTLFKEATEKQVSRKPSLLKSIQIPDRIVSCGIDQPHTWNSDFPMHVSGVNKKSRLNWTPWSFSKAFGKMDCEIQEGLTGDIRKTKISSFFDNFGVEKRESGVWSLKGWPPSVDLKVWQPDIYEDFLRLLPMPDLTRPDGVLNLASRLPTNGYRPVLGPQLYCAYSSSDESTLGTTKLHVDVIDALNILVHASRQKGYTPEAVWYIYPPKSLSILREYCFELLARHRSTRQKPVTVEEVKEKLENPIHRQQIYLGPSMREELAKRGAKPWVIRQRVGDAVIIPAGCAYQSCNFADCIKIASYFVSAESVSSWSNASTNQTKLLQSVVWRGSIPDLKHILYHAWMSLKLPPGRLQPNLDTSVDQPRSSPVSSRLDQTKAPSGSGTSSATFNKQLSSKRPSQHASHSPLTVMTAEAGLAGSSASPSPFNSNSFDQPPMSDVRSTSACSARSTEPVADMTTPSNPASTDSSRASPAIRSIEPVNRQSNAQATPIIVGGDVEMEVDTPPMSKRPLPRLRARSLTQIEPALKPTPESEVRVRPASSLPEDQSAFLDSIIKSLLDPSKFGRGIVFNDDAFKSALPKIEVIVQKVYTSSMYGGDIEERLKAVEPALQVLFEPIFKAPKPSGSSGDDRPQEMVLQAQERLGRQHESRNTTATPSARQAASDQTLPVNRSDPLAATLHQEGTVPSTPNDIAAASFLQVPAPQRTQQDMPVLPAASGSSPVGLSASRALQPFSAQSHGAQPAPAGPSIAPASPVPPSAVQSSNAQLNTTQPSNVSQLTTAVPIAATTQELVQSTTPTTSPRSATSHPSISRPNTPASVGQPSPYYAATSASNRPSGTLSGSMPAQALNGFARAGAIAFGRSSPLAVPAGKSATPGRSVAATFSQTGLPRSSPLASPLVGSTQTTQVGTRLMRDPTSAAPRASQPGPVVVPLVIPPHPMNVLSSPAVVPAQELTSTAPQSYPRYPHRPTLEDVIPLTGDSPDPEPEELEVWGSTRAAFYYAWIG